MDSHPSQYSQGMSTVESPYSQQSQPQSQQWSQQTPHLIPPSHNQSSFPSPSSPTASLSEQHYPPYYQQQQPQQQHSGQSGMNDGIVDRVVDRSSTALSLNLSSLSVASPTNLSPINPSPHPSTQASTHVSPITPISPSTAGLHPQISAHHHHSHHHHHPHMQQPFQFAAPDHGVRYDEGHYDYSGRRLTSSRSSSSSEKSVPRKRSFPTVSTLATSVEETAYDHSMGTSPYDEVDMSYGGLDAEGSPIDGSTSGGEQDDQLKPMEGQIPTGGGVHAGMPSSMGLLGKPLGTNNFVTKLYQWVTLLCIAYALVYTNFSNLQDDKRPKISSVHNLDRTWNQVCIFHQFCLIWVGHALSASWYPMLANSVVRSWVHISNTTTSGS